MHVLAIKLIGRPVDDGVIIIIFFLAHQHKAAGMKIKLSKNNDHDGILLGVKSA